MSCFGLSFFKKKKKHLWHATFSPVFWTLKSINISLLGLYLTEMKSTTTCCIILFRCMLSPPPPQCCHARRVPCLLAWPMTSWGCCPHQWTQLWECCRTNYAQRHTMHKACADLVRPCACGNKYRPMCRKSMLSHWMFLRSKLTAFADTNQCLFHIVPL